AYCKSEISYLLKDSVIHQDTSFNYLKNNNQFYVDYRRKGFYLEVTITASNKLDSAKVSYLVGNKINNYFDNALVISKPNLSISYSGSTKIEGNILSSANLITQGKIFGISSPDKNYLDGKIIRQDNIPGKLEYDFIFDSVSNNIHINHSNSSIKEVILDTISRHDYLIESDQDLLISGFQSKPQKIKKVIIKSNKKVNIKGIISNYDLEIYSDSTVTIDEDSQINNLFVLSNNGIVIYNSILQNIQLISYKDIKMYDANLKYPSSLGIYVKTSNKDNLKNLISLENSIVNGTIILVSDIIGLQANKSKIQIDETSLLNGIVYCENNSEIKGNIIGSVYTYNTFFYQAPTEYVNWLINLNINRNNFASNDFLLPISPKNNKFKILKEVWYY
ncbi:MAG TPA: hypothetical protein VK250_05165, partial [Nitrososphaeraceae archaeon]|nr:hypothetical protein [Nitrososphaeraceae archaeon]